ncbi:MAG TPA: hypothetical protein VFB45_22885 [Pseudolabrys sp.]|nr:hypothetical protein [Pseudolabrys sp.]
MSGIAILALVLVAGSAVAGDLADFNAAVETAASHNRVAAGYLRTGNVDLASVELDRFKDAWNTLVERFAGKPPDAFAGNPLFASTLIGVRARIVAANLMIDSRRPDSARDALTAVREDLSKLRRSSGIVLLADCVLDANKAMDTLFIFNDRKLDWAKPEIAFDIAAGAGIYGHELARCDRMASEDIKNNPEFRRLIDGALGSLRLVPKAVATHDADMLHRILIELRSFDNLLAFRFG